MNNNVKFFINNDFVYFSFWCTEFMNDASCSMDFERRKILTLRKREVDFIVCVGLYTRGWFYKYGWWSVGSLCKESG